MTNSLKLRAIEGELLPEEATFQARLRVAMFDGVTEGDVADVIKGIVAKAKEGDPRAQRMFFEYLLGAKTTNTVNVTNNFDSVESAARAEKGKRKLA